MVHNHDYDRVEYRGGGKGGYVDGGGNSPPPSCATELY